MAILVWTYSLLCCVCTAYKAYLKYAAPIFERGPTIFGSPDELIRGLFVALQILILMPCWLIYLVCDPMSLLLARNGSPSLDVSSMPHSVVKLLLTLWNQFWSPAAPLDRNRMLTNKRSVARTAVGLNWACAQSGCISCTLIVQWGCVCFWMLGLWEKERYKG